MKTSIELIINQNYEKIVNILFLTFFDLDNVETSAIIKDVKGQRKSKSKVGENYEYKQYNRIYDTGDAGK